MTKVRKSFSRNLKKLRLDRGYTQEQFAERLGISVRYIQQLEGKNTPNVKIDTLEVLAKELKVKVHQLLL